VGAETHVSILGNPLSKSKENYKMTKKKNPLEIPSKAFYQIVLPDGRRLDDMYTWRKPGEPLTKGAGGAKRWKQLNYLKSRISNWLSAGAVSNLLEARVVKFVPTYEVVENMSVAEFVGKEEFSEALTKEQLKRKHDEAKRKRRLEMKLRNAEADKAKRKLLYKQLKEEFEG